MITKDKFIKLNHSYEIKQNNVATVCNSNVEQEQVRQRFKKILKKLINVLMMDFNIQFPEFDRSSSQLKNMTEILFKQQRNFICTQGNIFNIL